MPTTHNNSEELSARAAKPRLLMVAFACNPKKSMETRVGWRRALLAAESCDTTVLVGPGECPEKLAALAASEIDPGASLRFVGVKHDRLSRLLCRSASTYYLGYRRWGLLAYRAAKQLHKRQPFDATHQVTFCGYREPGLVWKLDAPFIWGPVGGTQDFPAKFLSVVTPLNAAKELVRSAVNWWQMRFCPRVRGAARRALELSAASTTGKEHVEKVWGVNARLELETGLDCQLAQPRARREQSRPLRVLWAGRLRPWKGFPLLINALQQLPTNCRVQVRVMGEGPCLGPWRRQAEKAGVAHMIEWVGWFGYDDTLPHYQWADVFAFTSLRDTSGTGLLESLAHGVPIVGLDHQGAADIMTPECAAPIALTTPRQVAADFAGAIARLASDPAELLQMSQSAQRRAAEFDWAERSESTRAMYQRAAGRVSTETTKPARQRRRAPQQAALVETGAGVTHPL